MRSPFILTQVERLGAGAGLKHMVLKSIRALEIPYPNMSHQMRITENLREKMSVAEKARLAVNAELETIGALPSALLQRAFSGEM